MKLFGMDDFCLKFSIAYVGERIFSAAIKGITEELSNTLYDEVV